MHGGKAGAFAQNGRADVEQMTIRHQPKNRDARIPDAQLVGLHHVDGDAPGIRRQRCGRGFRFFRASGEPVRDRETLARLRSLAVPPAWTDVWICEDPNGHIQATGRDDRGRKQFCYHPQWIRFRDETKFGRLLPFARALPDLRKRVDADLKLTNRIGRDHVIATIVWLLDHTMIRIGNAAYARENKSYGLTTLRSRHLDVDGSRLRFSFRGKSGKDWKIRLINPRMARVVRSIQELPGQHLFQYLDEDGITRHPITSQDVNGYIRETAGDQVSSKDFRTWGGTVRAIGELSCLQKPETARLAAQVLNKAIDDVARQLGNTRAVCRQRYIHPAVIESWRAGQLGGEIAKIRRSMKPVDGLDEFETVVLGWLEHHRLCAQIDG